MVASSIIASHKSCLEEIMLQSASSVVTYFQHSSSLLMPTTNPQGYMAPSRGVGDLPHWGGVGTKAGDVQFCLQQRKHQVPLLLLRYCCKEPASQCRENTADPVTWPVGLIRRLLISVVSHQGLYNGGPVWQRCVRQQLPWALPA